MINEILTLSVPDIFLQLHSVQGIKKNNLYKNPHNKVIHISVSEWSVQMTDYFASPRTSPWCKRFVLD